MMVLLSSQRVFRLAYVAMSTFVLIHGGWHAAWCWIRVATLLGNHGHRVIAPDLPAHGADSTPFTARPYEMYVPKVCEVLDRLDDRAILVGHSSGGMILTEVAQRRSARIKSLVYLSAFLLPSGKTPRDVMTMDTESVLRSCLEIDLERGVSLVRPECAKTVFYADCSEDDAQWAISRLQPEPLIPPGPSIVNAGDSGSRTAKFYIECLQDKALGPRMQRWMYTESQCDGVYSLPTSHSPFLSAPTALVQCLLEIDSAA
jgi:pimeloyl-ACP methyl ester carboxylesterase